MIAGFPVRQILGRRGCVLAMLSAIAAMAALLAVTVNAWQPAVLRHRQTGEMRRRLISEIASLQEQGQITLQFEERRKQAGAMETKLSSEMSDPDFIRAIESLTSKSGVSLVQFSSQPAREEKGGMRLDLFESSLRGNYAAIRGFIAGIHRLPVFVTIERIVFEKSDDDLRVRVVLKRLAKV